MVTQNACKRKLKTKKLKQARGSRMRPGRGGDADAEFSIKL